MDVFEGCTKGKLTYYQAGIFSNHMQIFTAIQMRDAKPSEATIKHKDEILKFMAVLLDNSRFLEVQNEKGIVNNMCEVLDRIEEKGVGKAW